MARQEVLLAQLSIAGKSAAEVVPTGFCKVSQGFSQKAARLKYVGFFSPRMKQIEFLHFKIQKPISKV